VDTFETETPEGWFFGGGPGGSGGVPSILTTGGPAGAGDAFMRLVSLGGTGPGSRLTASNAAQWSGNYIAAGVVAIAMDVNNTGRNDLSLRLVFETLPPLSPPTNIAFTDDPIFVPAGSGWMHIVFPVTPGALLNNPAIPGSTALGALSDATLIRIYHDPADNSPNPFVPIPAIVAELGVDNIAALAAPEPSTGVLLVTGGLALAFGARRVRRG
jgi:hypothetical protein